MLLLLATAFNTPAYACVSADKYEVYEGELVQFTLDEECLKYDLSSDWETSWNADLGSFVEEALFEAVWQAPELPYDDMGQRVSVYITSETPDHHRAVYFIEVVVYPSPEGYPTNDDKGCTQAPTAPGWWLLFPLLSLSRRSRGSVLSQGQPPPTQRDA